MIETICKAETDIQKLQDQEDVFVFTRWSVFYADIIETSKLFNKVFGTQMTFMLVAMTCRYILFLYAITALGITGAISTVTMCFNIIVSTYMLFELALVSSSAQQTRNNTKILRKQLSKLLLQLVDDDNYYKPAKDLLRLVSTRAINIQATGSIGVDMTLLPTCVVFFIHYTVIALQFNNIV
ncbi:hypothetical protein O0L34_g5100 [Tuta absoluta]|nr:hypothetical protein O0L34_g5100 [Tuta absoluta]